jgi:pimeloyl-ACP methyl ester carboxylesterase
MRLIVLLLFGLPFITIAQGNQALLQKADSFYRAKNYAEAARLGEAFLKTDSTSDGVTYSIAVYHAMAGQNSKAMYYLRQAFKLGFASKYLEQQPNLVNLHNEKDWPDLVKLSAENYNLMVVRRAQKAKEMSAMYKAWQKEWEAKNRVFFKKSDFAGSAETLYKRFKTFNNYKPVSSLNRYLLFYYNVKDSTDAPFTVLLPKDYCPDVSYPVLIVLHGAVGMQASFPPYPDSAVTGHYNRHFTKYATANNMIVVYPSANSQYNWMYPDDGFVMVPSIATYLKQFLNIDDHRVYLTGHSNGATGAFSYLMKAPNLFAAFTGMNTQPKVRTGGTFLMNALNRSFYAIATDKDYYYPPQANDSLLNLAKEVEIDWTLDMNKGYPHWFPQYDAADEAVRKMFVSLVSKRRNPFHASLYWQCDDVTYGRCDWLSITELDTLKQPAAWQKQYNFGIHSWIDRGNPDKIIDSTEEAFHFPRKSGAVKAGYKNNRFTIKTSGVKSIRLYLSPEMIDFTRPITIVLNNKKVFYKKMNYNKAFLLDDFERNFDRRALWVNGIDLKL